MYQVGQSVTVIIDDVYSHGVFAHIKNSRTKVYIRRRELTLSRNINPPDQFQVGQELAAVIIELAAEGRLLELSARSAIPDPWIDFTRRVQVNDVLNGRVKYLYPHKVVVEIEPGVDGSISLDEISDRTLNKPEDVLWTNDRVQAVVISIDQINKKLHLSIKRLLNRLMYAHDVLENINKLQGADRKMGNEVQAPPDSNDKPINYFGKILVVDDQKDVREPLVQWLIDAGCDAEGSDSGYDALRKCKEQIYSLLIVDINMPGLDGIGLIHSLKEMGIPSTITIMTGSELAEYHGSSLENLNVSALFIKPLDLSEIRDFLIDLTLSRVKPFKLIENGIGNGSKHQPFEKVLQVARSSLPIGKRLELVLEHLLDISNAESAALFYYDPISRLFSIKAKFGQLEYDEAAINNLVASPVEDVITEQEIVWEKRVSDRPSAFRKLYDMVQFESCMGVPVHVAGRCDHALFIFHREPNYFSRYRLRDVRTNAALCSIAMESDLFHHQIQNIAPIILTGQLTSALNHEIANQITALEFQILHLNRVMAKLENGQPPQKQIKDIQDARTTCAKLDETVSELSKIVKDFRRIRTANQNDQINVNAALKTVWENIRKTAAKDNVDIWLKIDDEIPDIVGNAFALYCTFYNLTLNAIQQLGKKPGERLVKIQPSYICEKGKPVVYVRVMDNGPGIHRQQWEKIYELGFTTRENGSGLGLFIARSLTEAYGGKIIVEESLIQLGTTFLVQLPVEMAR
jgi:signal transduction histidine kinase/CheY-like chemotaxis protein/predicted RNA-binding protein with RPS1 domain